MFAGKELEETRAGLQVVKGAKGDNRPLYSEFFSNLLTHNGHAGKTLFKESVIGSIVRSGANYLAGRFMAGYCAARLICEQG